MIATLLAMDQPAAVGIIPEMNQVVSESVVTVTLSQIEQLLASKTLGRASDRATGCGGEHAADEASSDGKHRGGGAYAD